MKTKAFIARLDDRKLTEAIAAAERQTSGEIRIFISDRAISDAMAEARRQFILLGMEKTRQRNAILIFIAPRSRQFALFGDEGIHQKGGETFWQELVTAMSAKLRAEDYMAALEEVVGSLGGALARHFPPTAEDEGELPNSVVRD